MTPNHQKPEFLRLQARVKREHLAEICRKEGRTVTATLRVASHLVHDEDAKGENPTKCTAAVELAKAIHRLEHKADDPQYPESARQWYLENEAKNEQFLARLLHAPARS